MHICIDNPASSVEAGSGSGIFHGRRTLHEMVFTIQVPGQLTSISMEFSLFIEGLLYSMLCHLHLQDIVIWA